MSLNCILKFLREAGGKFPRGNIPRDSTGKGGGNIHIPLHCPFISAGKPWGNFRKDDPLEFPQKSVWNSWGCGWLAWWVRNQSSTTISLSKIPLDQGVRMTPWLDTATCGCQLGLCCTMLLARCLVLYLFYVSGPCWLSKILQINVQL